MKKYIIDTVNPKDFTAGSKARNDIEHILIKSDYEKLAILVGENKKKILREVCKIKKQLKNLFKSMENNSIAVFQYPWGTLSYGMARIIRVKTKKKHIKSVVIIHDLNSVRTGAKVTELYYRYFVREIKYLSQFDYIICHNECMRRYLIENGICKEKVFSLHIFDYLTNIVEKEIVSYDLEGAKIVNIAGNLSKDKTGYIYKLPDLEIKNYSIHLYGPFYEGEGTKQIIYKGKYPADELPKYLTEGFGLVWDGTDIDTCKGHFGEYLKINNPHKLSLYIACGIPVIVWKHAAVARFVENNEIGYCVETLEEINNLMENITDEKYQVLRKNVVEIQKKVKSGYYIQVALDKVEHDLKERL